ncbi:class I SAM-dependent methyltransferase [Cellulomonas chengniuliangii]|uniref:Methyltransferase domain-containing protein n=1 Tax=Cellulomonas chengniuliangii TaxID=2968084 RepID=A0ABY5KVC2_9CELL|nr:methyltransferase domain-containing protein [Cellulomonas chengniuliangii]MCC2308870.1 methyltransferase domain-containing protein [Cellulomonas chengniuliangii]MCC2317097.1 methyltransferase domain-containing protein [Cellulomonas chengniuliangii]UUI74389.1 methyltransferase domain-containing protein [Cellulomonas chengniuliangii]
MTNHKEQQHDHHHGPGGDAPTSPEVIGWEAWYAAQQQVWSGQVNGVVAAELTGVAPGRVLDVGCGEGGDAVWLAAQGWDVTAVDVAAAALERGRAAARAAGVEVRWVQADLAGDAPDLGTYDVVSVQYPALPRTPDEDAIRTVLASVAPGGMMLATWHADMDAEHARSRGFELEDFVQRADVVAHLDEAWVIEVDEVRERVAPPGQGSHHTRDLVLRARRAR